MGTAVFWVPSSGHKRSELTDQVMCRSAASSGPGCWGPRAAMEFSAHTDECSPTAPQTAKTSRVVMATGPHDRLMSTRQKLCNSSGPRTSQEIQIIAQETPQHLWRVLNWDPGLWVGLGSLGKGSQVHNSFTALRRSLFTTQSTLGCAVNKKI